jgi:hypothetical protein
VVWNGVHSASWVQLRSYLKEKVAAPVYRNQEYGRRDSSRWPRGTLYPQKYSLTSPTSSGRSVDMIRWRTKALELLLVSYAVIKFIVIDWTKYFGKCQQLRISRDPMLANLNLISRVSCKWPLCISLHRNWPVRSTQLWLRLSTLLLRSEEEQRLTEDATKTRLAL